MSNYYGLIFIIAGGIFLALPAVVSSDLSKRKKKCNATAGRALVWYAPRQEDNKK